MQSLCGIVGFLAPVFSFNYIAFMSYNIPGLLALPAFYVKQGLCICWTSIHLSVQV